MDRIAISPYTMAGYIQLKIAKGQCLSSRNDRALRRVVRIRSRSIVVDHVHKMRSLAGASADNRACTMPNEKIISEQENGAKGAVSHIRHCLLNDLNLSNWTSSWLEFRCIFLVGKGTEDDEGIAVFGRPEGVHFEAG